MSAEAIDVAVHRPIVSDFSVLALHSAMATQLAEVQGMQDAARRLSVLSPIIRYVGRLDLVTPDEMNAVANRADREVEPEDLDEIHEVLMRRMPAIWQQEQTVTARPVIKNRPVVLSGHRQEMYFLMAYVSKTFGVERGIAKTVVRQHFELTDRDTRKGVWKPDVLASGLVLALSPSNKVIAPLMKAMRHPDNAGLLPDLVFGPGDVG